MKTLLLLIALFLGFGLSFGACSYSNDWQTAEQDGVQFAKKFTTNPNVAISVECAQLDTDLNGYCSCTATIGGQIRSLECGCPRHSSILRFSDWFDPKTELRGCRLDRYINRNLNIGDGDNGPHDEQDAQ